MLWLFTLLILIEHLWTLHRFLTQLYCELISPQSSAATFWWQNRVKLATYYSVSRVLKQDPGTIMENISRFNWWCPPVLGKQTSFGPQNQFSVNNILSHRCNRTVRCFRCKEVGHYAKECTSEKVIKSRRKQKKRQPEALFIY